MKPTVLAAALAVSTLSTTTARAETRVFIDSDNDEITLNQITSEASASAYGSGGSAVASSMGFHVVCRAPCNQRVSAHYKYFIDGEGMPRSRKFLVPLGGDVTLKVKTGSSGVYWTGAGFMVAGSIAATSGLLAGAMTGEEDLIAGMVGVGLPVAILGIAMMVKGRTTVKVHRGTGVALDVRRGALTF